MNAEVKFGKKLGGCLTAAGGIAFIASMILHGGPGTIGEFLFLVLMIVGVMLIVPGILLGYLSYLLKQIDERFRLLEEKMESGPRQGSSSEKMS